MSSTSLVAFLDRTKYRITLIEILWRFIKHQWLEIDAYMRVILL